ncbi:MAG: hypothetical protein NPIRA02_39240 [Nitrospirales bacterium]|nr:MAG: hypothetical protein NPIRA02_39240 [Nitrospirales bacterium]
MSWLMILNAQVCGKDLSIQQVQKRFPFALMREDFRRDVSNRQEQKASPGSGLCLKRLVRYRTARQISGRIKAG